MVSSIALALLCACVSYAGASNSSSPDVGGGMIRLQNVCYTGLRDIRIAVYPQPPSNALLRRCAERSSGVRARAGGRIPYRRSDGDVNRRPRRLNDAATPIARDFCRTHRKRKNAQLWTQAYLDSFSMTEQRVQASRAVYPPRGAQRIKRGAIFKYMGNIGHDALLEGSMIDHFALQRASGGVGFFDAMMLEVHDLYGWANFAAAVKDSSSSWTMSMLKILFGADLPLFYYPHKTPNAGAAKSNLPAGGVCFDELYVRAKAWDVGALETRAIEAVPALRDTVVRAVLGRLPPPADAALPRSVVVYARSETNRKLLVRDEASLRAALNVTTFLRQMPRGFHDQVALFANADVMVTAHGANEANTIFMKPGAVNVEIIPACVGTVLEGCFFRYTGKHLDLLPQHFDAFGVPRGNAAKMLMSFYPAYHYKTGVRFHVLSQCVLGEHCKRGVVSLAASVKYDHRDWKYDHNQNTVVDEKVVQQLRNIVYDPESADALDSDAVPKRLPGPLAEFAVYEADLV